MSKDGLSTRQGVGWVPTVGLGVVLAVGVILPPWLMTLVGIAAIGAGVTLLALAAWQRELRIRRRLRAVECEPITLSVPPERAELEGLPPHPELNGPEVPR